MLRALYISCLLLILSIGCVSVSVRYQKKIHSLKKINPSMAWDWEEKKYGVEPPAAIKDEDQGREYVWDDESSKYVFVKEIKVRKKPKKKEAWAACRSRQSQGLYLCQNLLPKEGCEAGNYDTDSEKGKDLSMSCYKDGTRKTYVKYRKGKKEEEHSYYPNGGTKSYIEYDAEGRKEEEHTYYSNGDIKTHIEYDDEGKKKDDYPMCFAKEEDSAKEESWTEDTKKKNGFLNSLLRLLFQSVLEEEICTKEKHGCTLESHSCSKAPKK